MPTYTWKCKGCSREVEDVVAIAERDNPYQWLHIHTDCNYGDGTEMQRVIAQHAPSVTRVSYVDGQKRRGWAEMREIRKLRREIRSARDRGERPSKEMLLALNGARRAGHKALQFSGNDDIVPPSRESTTSSDRE